MKDDELKQLLRGAGLLHLFVVSGAHLIWLEHLLARIRIPFFFRVAGWTIFSLACGWQPPVVRAWVGLLLIKLEPKWTPALRADQHVLLTGLVTLLLFPPWGDSLSLALSWIAAFALSLPSLEGWKGEFWKCFLIWILLMPLLVTWSPAGPVTVLVNFLLAPVFSVVLIPLGLACVALPMALPIFDFLFSLFTKVLTLIPDSSSEVSGRVPASWELWVWVILFHVSAHLVLTYRKRRTR